jgi:hypothetical protein
VDLKIPCQRSKRRLEGRRSGDLDLSDDLELDGSDGGVWDVVDLGCSHQGHHNEG